VEDRFIGFGRDHLRRWRPLPCGGKTHRFVGSELEPYVAVAFCGRHSAYFTSILSGVNVSCNAESNVLRRADNQPQSMWQPAYNRLFAPAVGIPPFSRWSDGKMRSLAYEGSALPMKAAHLSPDRPRSFPVVRYWRKAPQHDAGTERYLTRFLVRQEYTANDEPRKLRVGSG
jgi:hypothetical protein